MKVISAYMQAQSLPLSLAVVLMSGQYGNGAIVADLAGLAYVMRGKDYNLLNLQEVQTRLAQPPDQQTTHPETGTCRALFDCPDLPLTPTRARTRVIVATHPATSTAAPIGTTRGEVAYSLFFTALPQEAFTPADVVALYLHRGAFETVLSDEDQEQVTPRWCSHAACGQEFWQILSQWVWNPRLELGHALHPTPMRTTEFAPAQVPPDPVPRASEPASGAYGPPQWARQSYTKGFTGADFSLRAFWDATLSGRAPPVCARTSTRTQWLGCRVLYAARIGHCRGCPLREHCQEKGPATIKPRRVSAVFWPVAGPPPEPAVALALPPAAHPILWKDWSRCQTRRAWMALLRTQTVTVTILPAAALADPTAIGPFTRRQRAHWRLSWTERLARNACSKRAPLVELHLFGIPTAFATSLGLAVAERQTA